MREQTLILVDENDNFLGYAPHDECHRGQGKRHRAFVTLLFDSQNRVLLQKRKHKLFDNLWDLTAVSHPLHLESGDESYQEASDRALRKEMGISHVPIKKVGAFNYFAQDGQNCENEYCTILVGEYDGDYRANPNEAYETKKINFKEFIKDVSKNPKKYTPWTKLAVKHLVKVPPRARLAKGGKVDPLRKSPKANLAISGRSEARSQSLFKNELNEFLSVFEPYAKKYFEKKIKEVQKYPKIIRQFWQDLADFTSGGKKLRAFLVYLGYLIGENKGIGKILPVALAFEVAHSFFLIHDDIIDQSDVRRGKPTIHKKYSGLFGSHYGISQAIILGDLACLEAFDLINSSLIEPSLKNLCFSYFLRILRQTVYGQGLDIEYAYREATLSAIRQVTDLKTARYSFVGPLTVGAVLANANQNILKAIETYGLAVGLAFQIQDDILGVFGDEKVLGKPVLSDMREGKNTILIYKTREMADSKQQRMIAQLWGKRDGNMRDIGKIREIIESSTARQWCQSEQAKLVGKVKKQVHEITADKNIQKILFQLADFVVTREK